jgi:hypothetical protein
MAYYVIRKAILVSSILFLVICIGSSTHAQTLVQVFDRLEGAYTKETKQSRKLLSKFDETEKKAKETLQNSLKQLRSQAGLNNNPLGAADLNRQITNVENWLIQGGDLPKSDFLLPLLFEYVKQLYEAKIKLDKGLKSFIERLRKDGRSGDAKTLGKALVDACPILDSSQVIEQGRSFGGNRWSAKSTEPTRIDLKIETVMGNAFSGKIERDTGISMHPVHGMSGMVNGLNIVIDTQGPRDPGRKKDGDWTYCGILVGRTIIGSFAGRGAKGNVGGGHFRLDQR